MSTRSRGQERRLLCLRAGSQWRARLRLGICSAQLDRPGRVGPQPGRQPKRFGSVVRASSRRGAVLRGATVPLGIRIEPATPLAHRWSPAPTVDARHALETAASSAQAWRGTATWRHRERSRPRARPRVGTSGSEKADLRLPNPAGPNVCRVGAAIVGATIQLVTCRADEGRDMSRSSPSHVPGSTRA